MASTIVPFRRRLAGALLLRRAASLVVFVVVARLLSVAVVEAQYDTIDGHRCFRNLAGMTEAMFDLQRSYPNLASVEDVGDSYLKSRNDNSDDYPLPQNGYDIWAMNVTAHGSKRGSADKGKMLIISGVHPREYAPPELTMRFAESLLSEYGVDADVTWLLQNAEVHIIFHVNPDSRYVTETHPETFWRKNQNPGGGSCRSSRVGVDLNRNYDFMWGDQDGASDDECDSTYHGRSPESEPETRAVVDYAKRIFPAGQRRDDPEDMVNTPLGEDIMGIFVDVHSPGGYIFYPWGHKNAKSKDDDALQATARKMSYFNGYTLWAGGQPDFQYATSGDSSDYMYAALGVASFGLELGEDFYEDCGLFEDEVVPDNLSALLYLAKNSKKPFSLAKGPDILGLVLSNDNIQDGIQYGIKVTVVASDSRLVNSIRNYPDFPATGGQGVAEVRVYLDVHPDDFKEGDLVWDMKLVDDNSDEQTYELEVTSPDGFSAGRHTLYVQARDGRDYFGPATGAFFDVERRPTKSPTVAPTTNRPSKRPTSRPTARPTTKRPSEKPTSKPTSRPSNKPTVRPTAKPTTRPTNKPTLRPTTAEPSSSPTGKPITARPTFSPSRNPTDAPSDSPTTANPSSSPTTSPTSSPSSSPTHEPSRSPSKAPTALPTISPSTSPTTSSPSSKSSTNPSTIPSINPSSDPSSQPSDAPTPQPTKSPTVEPIFSPAVVDSPNPEKNPGEPTTDTLSQVFVAFPPPPSSSPPSVGQVTKPSVPAALSSPSNNASCTARSSAVAVSLFATALLLLYLG